MRNFNEWKIVPMTFANQSFDKIMDSNGFHKQIGKSSLLTFINFQSKKLDKQWEIKTKKK